ncbi:putative ubiquitin-like modifier [Mycena pura]|uniref:Ubiquitin-like protein ATG12 n=1 Tax=Mycena pura TaxID=153505 RepID=A0AAD6V3J3_9AGAR|nr:putative ubiquitin-like modifier [Mycena pura]
MSEAETTSSEATAHQLPPWATAAQTDINDEALAALETYKKRDPSKVVVRFKAVGNAPIMKQNFYKITASNRFQAVIQFLRKELGWKSGDPLVCFSRWVFSFCTDGHLIVNYSTTAAWG